MSGRLEAAAGPGRWLLVGLNAAEAAPWAGADALAVQTDAAAHEGLVRQGFRAATSVEGRFDAAAVRIDRARARSRARIAAADAALPAGAPLWIDGQKTDGIEAMLRDIRALAPVDEVISRAHGKLFRVTRPEGAWLPQDWAGAAQEAAPGFVTLPGVFSADGVDPASAMLAAALPGKMPTRVVDLGAGWGWLGAQVLARPGVEVLHLVEADHDALTAARRNISDPRAVFHWADATQFRLPEPVNGVVMNPPFHAGRSADPGLGRGFIAAAAGLLTGAGRLWMVANRHLPYERTLSENFAQVAEISGDNRFKVLTASGARRRRQGLGASG